MQKTDTGILNTKQHFEILDGLRGYSSGNCSVSFYGNGLFRLQQKFHRTWFFSCRLFFCLSGFVIGYAYDDRIGKIGIIEFFKSRIIRLHPLVIVGSVLGLLSFLFDPFGGHPELYGAGKIILIFLTSIFLIPFPVMAERSFNLFGFNAPSWSLFWEYVANIFYAFILCKISRRYLIILTILSASALCFVCYYAESLMGGWGRENFWDGGARISYSFLAGLMVYRFNWIIKTKLGFIGLSALLALSFIMPYSPWNWLAEPMVVLFYFPLLIALGAGATLTRSLKDLCVFSGNISYPLNMTHYAAIWIFANYYNTHKVSTTQLFFIITIGTILLIGLAYLLMKVNDIPVRKYLTEKRRKV